MNVIRHDAILFNPNSIIYGIHFLNFHIDDFPDI